MLLVGEAADEGERELHSEANTVGVCDLLAKGDCELLPHIETECERALLGRRLPLEVEH